MFETHHHHFHLSLSHTPIYKIAYPLCVSCLQLVSQAQYMVALAAKWTTKRSTVHTSHDKTNNSQTKPGGPSNTSSPVAVWIQNALARLPTEDDVRKMAFWKSRVLAERAAVTAVSHVVFIVQSVFHLVVFVLFVLFVVPCGFRAWEGDTNRDVAFIVGTTSDSWPCCLPRSIRYVMKHNRIEWSHSSINICSSLHTAQSTTIYVYPYTCMYTCVRVSSVHRILTG